MIIGTPADIVVALTAVCALILSIYNTYAQRRDAAKQDERWREEQERQQREREPSLFIEMDSRRPPGRFAYISIYSCRIVNDGYMPVEIRTLRIVLDDSRMFPMPELHEDLIPMLLENERPVTKPAVPTILQPGQSVRYATLKDQVGTVLRNAGFSGSTKFSVTVVDALDNYYTAEDSLLVGYPEPDP